MMFHPLAGLKRLLAPNQICFLGDVQQWRLGLKSLQTQFDQRVPRWHDRHF